MMENKKYYFFIFIFIIIIPKNELLSQYNKVPGYVINAEGDSLFGEIRSIKKRMSYKLCNFINTEGQISTFLPDQVMEYGNTEFKYVSGINDTLFVRVLVEGAISLYQLNKIFYLKNEEGVISFVTDGDLEVYRNGIYEKFNKNKFIGILASNLKKCSDMVFEELQNISFSKNDLTNIIIEYNNCIGSNYRDYSIGDYDRRIDLGYFGGISKTFISPGHMLRMSDRDRGTYYFYQDLINNHFIFGIRAQQYNNSLFSNNLRFNFGSYINVGSFDKSYTEYVTLYLLENGKRVIVDGYEVAEKRKAENSFHYNYVTFHLPVGLAQHKNFKHFSRQFIFGFDFFYSIFNNNIFVQGELIDEDPSYDMGDLELPVKNFYFMTYFGGSISRTINNLKYEFNFTLRTYREPFYFDALKRNISLIITPLRY